MSARNILNYIMDGGVFSEDVFKEMLGKKEISYHLMAKPEQLVDDLNGVLSPTQKRMIKELLKHLDELNAHMLSWQTAPIKHPISIKKSLETTEFYPQPTSSP